MADETARFAVELQDQVSGPAHDAANALVTLRAKIDEDTRALREMQAAMRRLQGGSNVNVQAFRELRDRINAQKASIAAAQAQYISLGGTFNKLAPPPAVEEASNGLEQLLESAKKLPGPLGSLTSRYSGLLSKGGLLIGGVTLLAVAFVTLSVAVIGAAIALTRYAIAQADARRSELLRIEALGGTKLAATEAQEAIDRVSRSTAMGREGVERIASSLYRAGLRGEALQERLRRLVIHRLGGEHVAAARMLELGVQVEKVKESLGDLFSGLRIEGFLSKLFEITQLFSQNTASGRALKVLLETMVQPLIDGVERAFPIFKRFFQGLLIGVLLFTLGVLLLKKKFEETFGDTNLFGNLDTLKLALYAGMFAAVLLISAFVALAVVIGAIAAVAGVFIAAWYAVYAAIDTVIDAIVAAWNFLQGLDFEGFGQTMINGLVNGIRSGTERVVGAVRDLAERSQSAFRNALGISSPSRVFAELGMQISRGTAEGINAGSPFVEGAAETMLDQVATPAPSRSVAVSIGEVHVHAESDDPGTMARDFVSELARLLEGAGNELGPEPA